ncbi:histidine phosphatase family protein [Nocardioides dongkuii]|uniref:histidine phosphatase family protein n=1 Tax=Nocardioides dongkuii TaxID=2760089 RepID=UPI001C704E3A|nr:histidine phosphatase family protein [Nocardioides dongkuii]
MAEQLTTVHLVRHGEVHNPSGLLYGRLPGFPLSGLGHTMAARVAEVLGERDVRHVCASPLERTRQTAQPLADRRGLEVVADDRAVEAGSHLEGRRLAGGRGVLRDPAAWRYLWNPVRPSWGEPYAEVVARMLLAVAAARDAARGHEAVLVSHQLPIWATRRHLEGRSRVHDPRRRQCSLCSVTSLRFAGDHVVRVEYSEPAADLLPVLRS